MANSTVIALKRLHSRLFAENLLTENSVTFLAPEIDSADKVLKKALVKTLFLYFYPGPLYVLSSLQCKGPLCKDLRKIARKTF